MKRSDKDSDLLNPLSVARKWLPWCLGLMFALTFGWTWFVYWYESNRGNHGDGIDVTMAVADRVIPSTPLIMLISIFIVTVADLVGGVIVVMARYLGNKFVEPLIEKRREEGRVEGRVEGKVEGRAEGKVEGRIEGIVEGKVEGRAEERLLWSEWNRRREEAEANGVRFAEPPPDRVGENGANGTS